MMRHRAGAVPMRSTSHSVDRQSVMVDSAAAPVIALTIRDPTALHHPAALFRSHAERYHCRLASVSVTDSLGHCLHGQPQFLTELTHTDSDP